jgi:hypothetical protein
MSEHRGGRPKGLPKTGGRQKGSPNRATVEREHAVAVAYASLAAHLGVSADKLKEVSPVEAMLLCMQWSLQARDRAGILAAASAVAPYLHARLSSAEVHVSGTVTIADLSDEELAAAHAELDAKIAAARLLN